MATYFCVNSSLGQTWNSSNTTMWSTTSGLTTTPAGPPAAADTATFDALSGGGTVTVGSSINTTNAITNLTMGAFTGTLDFSVNNPSLTISTLFSNNGSGTRTLNLGSGTFTLSGISGNVIDFGTVTGLTLNAGASNIVVSPVSAQTGSITVNTPSAAVTFNTLTLGPINTTSGNKPPIITFTGGKFTTINVNPNNLSLFVGLPGAGTLTVTNGLNWNGTSGNFVTLYGGGSGTTISSTINSVLTWAILAGTTFSGGGTATATNSIDMRGNTGSTITAPTFGVGGGVIIGN